MLTFEQYVNLHEAPGGWHAVHGDKKFHYYQDEKRVNLTKGEDEMPIPSELKDAVLSADPSSDTELATVLKKVSGDEWSVD